jgi:hypothetical protein
VASNIRATSPLTVTEAMKGASNRRRAFFILGRAATKRCHHRAADITTCEHECRDVRRKQGPSLK